MGTTTRAIVLTGLFILGSAAITAVASSPTLYLNNRHTERMDRDRRAAETEKERVRQQHEEKQRLDDTRTDTYVALLNIAQDVLYGPPGIARDNRKAFRECLFQIDLRSTHPVRAAAREFVDFASQVEGLKEQPELSGFGGDDHKRLWSLHDASIEAARIERGII